MSGWIGIYVLNLIIATIGVSLSVGLFGDALVPIVGYENVLSVSLKPPFPFQICLGIAVGYVSQVRWKGNRQALWVWIIPAVYLFSGIVSWVGAGYRLGDSLAHFVGLNCWPLCRDQHIRTVPFYTTVAYSIGAIAYRKAHPVQDEHQR
jgi:hypothetical protein